MNNNEKYMKLALGLARRGLGSVSPNPMVGCVIVKGGRIIGKGYHKKFGGPHAEVYALKQACGKAKGAVMYVTLEPCSHFGKTPPCTDAIIKSGVKKVVAAMIDPNPLNNSKGLKALRKAGIEVKVGILEDEARKLNEPFIKNQTKGLPFVTVKIAQSLDGKIATKFGESKWITNEASRSFVQRLRRQNDAILVGVNTILKDDPLLRNSKRKVILDSLLKTPADARVFLSSGQVIIATTNRASKSKEEALKKKGAIVLRFKGSRPDLKEVLLRLYTYGDSPLGRQGQSPSVSSVLIEGGAEVMASAFEEGLVDKAYFFIAPKVIGRINRLIDAPKMQGVSIRRFGGDVMLEGTFNVYRSN